MAMPPNPDTNEVLAAALVAREMELSVIPVGMDKRPLIPWAKYQHEAADEAEITRWFKEYPGAQLAIVTGPVSGITVIDFDDLNADWPPAGSELPTDAVVRTPRGGAHYYLPYIPGSRNSAGVLARGVDVRSEGGYVLCPPSRTEKGQYSFSVGDFFAIGSLRNAPQPAPWLATALRGRGPRPPPALPRTGVVRPFRAGRGGAAFSQGVALGYHSTPLRGSERATPRLRGLEKATPPQPWPAAGVHRAEKP